MRPKRGWPLLHHQFSNLRRQRLADAMRITPPARFRTLQTISLEGIHLPRTSETHSVWESYSAGLGKWHRVRSGLASTWESPVSTASYRRLRGPTSWAE